VQVVETAARSTKPPPKRPVVNYSVPAPVKAAPALGGNAHLVPTTLGSALGGGSGSGVSGGVAVAKKAGPGIYCPPRHRHACGTLTSLGEELYVTWRAIYDIGRHVVNAPLNPRFLRQTASTCTVPATSSTRPRTLAFVFQYHPMTR